MSQLQCLQCECVKYNHDILMKCFCAQFTIYICAIVYILFEGTICWTYHFICYDRTIWFELHAREWPFKNQPSDAIIWQAGRGMKPNLSQIGVGKEIVVCRMYTSTASLNLLNNLNQCYDIVDDWHIFMCSCIIWHKLVILLGCALLHVQNFHLLWGYSGKNARRI